MKACGNPYHNERGDVVDCSEEAPCRRCLLSQADSLKEQVSSLQRVLAHRRDSDSVVDA